MKVAPRQISGWAVWMGLLGASMALLGSCSCPQTDPLPPLGSATAAARVTAAGSVPAGSVPAGSVPAGSVPAGSVPAGGSAQPPLPPLPRTEILSPAEAEALLASSKPLALALDSAGATPRRALSYPWKSAAAVQLTVETVVALTVERAGTREQQTPRRLRIQLQAEPTEATDGTVWLELRVLDPAAVAGETAVGDGGAAAVGSGDEGEAAPAGPLSGVGSRRRYDARGVAQGAWSTPHGVAAEGLQLWASVAEAVADAVVPLPAAALGDGARWHTLERMQRAGATLLRATRYQLHVEADGEVRIEGRFREVAIAGRALDPALPAEVTVEVRAGVAKGSRQLTRPVGDWFARASSGELASDLQLLLSKGGASAEPTAVEITQLSSVERGGAVDSPVGSPVDGREHNGVDGGPGLGQGSRHGH